MLFNRLTRSAILAAFMVAGSAQASGPWLFETVAKGPRRLTAAGVMTTPNGNRDCSLILTASTGRPVTYQLDLRVAGATEVKDFHFDDFEGPEAKVTQKLFKIGVVGGKKPFEFSFCPAGGYVADPKNGFSFGCYEQGNKNRLFALLTEASKGSGRIYIKILDSKSPKVTLQAEFPLEDAAGSFQALIR